MVRAILQATGMRSYRGDRPTSASPTSPANTRLELYGQNTGAEVNPGTSGPHFGTKLGR